MLLQESIEAFVYCVLGAQSRTRWPIVGGSISAKNLQTQVVFRQVLEDTIVIVYEQKTLDNMRGSIIATNVVLNLAITPGLLLLPSRMVILKEPIPGYSNILRTAKGSKVVFGVNDSLNYQGVRTPQKKSHTGQPSSHLGSLPINKEHKQPIGGVSEKLTPLVAAKRKTTDSHGSDLVYIFGLAGVSTYFVMRYLV